MNQDPQLQSNSHNRLIAVGMAMALGIGGAACSSNEAGRTLGNETSTSSANGTTTTTGESSTTTNNETTTTVFDRLAAIKEALTAPVEGYKCAVDAVKTGTVDSIKLSDGSVFVMRKDNSLLPVDSTLTTENNRKWSDALASPVTAELKDSKAVLENVKATLCEDRLALVTYANMFANMEVEGVKVVDLVPDLAKYAGDAKNINKLAAEFPLTNEGDIKDAATLAKYDEMDSLASTVATLMGRFQVGEVDKEMPLAYYHVNVGSTLRVAGLPEVDYVVGVYDENNVFLPLYMTLKSGECVSVKIGVNVGDQRPVKLDSKCEEPKATTTTNGGHSTTTVPHGSTTTTRPNSSTTMPNKKPQTPIGEPSVPTIEAPTPGPSIPTTSNVPNTVGNTTSTTISVGPVDSAPQTPTTITAPAGF